MSKESYARGFCKAADAHGVDPVALAKLASTGDIVNAGLSSMTMGSPFAPKPFIPGTDTIKPTKDLQAENARNVIGGVTGIALAKAPALARAVGRFATKEIPAGIQYTGYGKIPYMTYGPRWDVWLNSIMETENAPMAVGAGGLLSLLGMGELARKAKNPIKRFLDTAGLTHPPAQVSATVKK